MIILAILKEKSKNYDIFLLNVNKFSAGRILTYI